MEGALVEKNYYQHKERLCNARTQFELQLKTFQSTKHLLTHNTCKSDFHIFLILEALPKRKYTNLFCKWYILRRNDSDH